MVFGLRVAGERTWYRFDGRVVTGHLFSPIQPGVTDTPVCRESGNAHTHTHTHTHTHSYGFAFIQESHNSELLKLISCSLLKKIALLASSDW